MADEQKTIDLIFNGIDKTGAATMAALDNAKKFTGALQNATGPIADFTVAAVKLEAGLLAGGLALTVFATKTAGDFEQAFAQISTLFDANATDLAKFKDDVRAYAEASGKSMDEVMGSLGAAIGSGVKYTESLDLMTVSERLSVATRSDMKGTTEVLVSVMNAYGIATKDAGALADLMFQIIKDGKIEMKDLSLSLANVTAIAAPAGVSMKEVGAAIATLTAAGMQPSSAIDALKSAITNILKPSEQAKDMAKELGIAFDGNTLKSKGLASVLDDVAAKAGGSAAKMNILFGDVNGAGAAMTLTGIQAEKFGESIKSMGASAGNVAIAYEKMGGQITVVTQKMTNAFTALMIEIGTPLLDEFGGIANAIANIFKALSDSVKEGGMKDLVAYIESVFKDIQTSLEAVAKNLPQALASANFGPFKDGIKSVIDAFKGLFSSIDLTTVDGLKVAIEAVGMAFLGLSKFTAGVIDAFKPLFDKLIEVGRGTKDVDLSFLEMAGNIGGIATQLNMVLPLFTTLLGILTVKSGLGLLTEFRALTLVLPTLATALTGAGVALATYFAAGNVIKLVNALSAWKTANDHLKDSQEESAKINDRAGLSLEAFAKSTGIVAKSVDEALALVKAGTVVWSTAANGYVMAGSAMADVADANGNLVGSFEKSNQAMLDANTASNKAADGANKLKDAQDGVNTYALKTVPILDELTGAVIGYEQQLVKSETGTVKLGDAAKKTSDDLKRVAAETAKAEEAQRKWNEEVKKMEFAEKLKLIEQTTKVMTANIEADAKKTVAAFDSIGTVIQSSDELLGNLFATFKDFGKMGFTEQWKIRDQINLENKRKDEQLKLQKQLIEAQVDLMKAQTDALVNGDALIKIEGDGLKPHLEAFMWAVLEAVQVKVNKDGMKMLLGV